MITWKNNEDLSMLFDKCIEYCNSTDFAVLIISQFSKETKEDGIHYEVICNFFPDEESRMDRDRVKLFSLEPEYKFKSPDRAIVSFPIEYIMTCYLQNKLPHKDVFIVTSLGDARDIVRKQISKKRAKKHVELDNVRTILLKDTNLHTINYKINHPYFITSYQIFMEKRKQDELRNQDAHKLDVDIKEGNLVNG